MQATPQNGYSPRLAIALISWAKISTDVEIKQFGVWFRRVLRSSFVALAVLEEVPIVHLAGGSQQLGVGSDAECGQIWHQR